MLRSLGLFEQLANKPLLDQQKMRRFAARDLAFDWAHMGNAELAVGDLIHAIRAVPGLRPPRTGHIGNWSNIVHARAGPRDYNHMTCGALGIGYPLLFDLNQTESDGTCGDWSYMPGSLVERCERVPLGLLAWDGQGFAACNRAWPRLTPFVLARCDGALVPLCALHRQASAQLSCFAFDFQSDCILQHEDTVKAVLRTLLAHASRQENPEILLRRIIDRQVHLDGRVEKAVLCRARQGYALGERRYDDADTLIDHTLLPLRMAATPMAFPQLVRHLPRTMPLMSTVIFVLLLAVLETHFPGRSAPVRSASWPCGPHLHWGGLPMAGAPPQERGYFAETARHLRKLFSPVIQELTEVAPVFFVLLPAGIFNLCPHQAFPIDLEAMSRLFDSVEGAANPLAGRPAEMSRAINHAVLEWQASVDAIVSPYLAGRFLPGPAGARSLPAPIEGDLALLPGFLRLTVQQASMTLGALRRTFARSCQARPDLSA